MSEEFESNNITPESYGEPQQNENKGQAIASMILGIVSIVLVCIFYWASIPCAIIGLILGIMYNKKNGKCGMSTAGIVCSIIGLVLAIIVLILAVIGIAALGALGTSLS